MTQRSKSDVSWYAKVFSCNQSKVTLSSWFDIKTTTAHHIGVSVFQIQWLKQLFIIIYECLYLGDNGLNENQ